MQAPPERLSGESWSKGARLAPAMPAPPEPVKVRVRKRVLWRSAFECAGALLLPWWGVVASDPSTGAFASGDAGFLFGFGWGDVPQVAGLALGPGFMMAPFSHVSLLLPGVLVFAAAVALGAALWTVGLGKVTLARVRTARAMAGTAAGLAILAAGVYVAVVTLAPYPGLADAAFGPFGFESGESGFTFWGPSVGVAAAVGAAYHGLRFVIRPD